jgi:hypothetical protein
MIEEKQTAGKGAGRAPLKYPIQMVSIPPRVSRCHE